MNSVPCSSQTIYALLLLFSVVAPARADLTLSIHPFRPASKLIDMFSPLAQYLSAQIGEPVEIKIALNYEAHLQGIGTDAVDIAYIGPAPYVTMTERYGPKPLLARQVIHGSPVFHGKIFVRNDSPIKVMKDLVGRRFVFGDPHSTMSYLVPRYLLWQAGVPVEKLGSVKHVSDHVNATLGVLAGEFDAGAVKEDVYFEYEARGLRALATSPGISDHLFVARSTLPPATIEKLREAMLTILENPDGAAIVGAITPGVTNLIQVDDKNYDNLRVILKKLKELGVDS